MKTKDQVYPLVSICIPTCNGEKYIGEAIQTALDQTYRNLEIIVSDDDSSDDTLNIIKSFVGQTEIPILIISHEPNGIGANWNNCVRHSKGDYIKFLFQDDLINADCIERMMELMMSSENIGMVYSKRKIIAEDYDEHSMEFIDFYGQLHNHWDTLPLKNGIMKGKAYLKDGALLNSPKNKVAEPVAVLLNRKCFDEIGWFNTDLRQTLDHEYWYRIMTTFDIGFLDQVLVGFRLHKTQASQVNRNGKNNEQDILLRSYYKHLFKYLHIKNKWKLLKLYHPFFKLLVKIKNP